MSMSNASDEDQMAAEGFVDTSCCPGCKLLRAENEQLQAEKGIVEVQRDVARQKDNAKLVSSLEAEVKQLGRDIQDGMQKNESLLDETIAGNAEIEQLTECLQTLQKAIVEALECK